MTLSANKELIESKKMETCYLCNSRGHVIYRNVKDRLYNVPGEWNVRKCNSKICGLVWIDPMPIDADIWKLYKNYFTHNESNQDDCSNSSCMQVDTKISFLNSSIKRALFSHYYNYEEYKAGGLTSLLVSLLSMMSLFRSRMGRKVMWLNGGWRNRLLDYGCGNGQFLGQMKNIGWDVVGYELDKQAAKVASDSFSINVYTGNFSEVAEKEGLFDVITLSHVIEHLPDPEHILQECKKKLKPGGKLVIVTPNFESLGSRYFKEYWRPLETPRHLYLFNTQTLSKIAEKTNMSVQKIWTHSDSASGIWRRSTVIRKEGKLNGGNPSKLPSYAKRGSKIFSIIEKISTKFSPCGEEMVAILEKHSN